MTDAKFHTVWNFASPFSAKCATDFQGGKQERVTIDSFFFEKTFAGFLREIRGDVDSFFGFPDGLPQDSVENAEAYRRMWECLKKDKKYAERGRRVVFVPGTAVVKERP